MTSEDRLADLLERWESAAQAGTQPTPDEFCADHPEDLPAFKELLRQLGVAGLVTATGKTTRPPHSVNFRAGRYKVTDYHAEGGLGVVYRATDQELNRIVALKCMKSAMSAESPAGIRFLQEAEITSRLEHPGVAPVHGRGKTDDGRAFYAMRFIDGETLQDATRQFHAPLGVDPKARKVEQRRLLRAFVGVCETVAYAHSRGIIHRDLKPSNVMVGPFGEVLVMDWGLAKADDRGQGSEIRGQKSETKGSKSELDDLQSSVDSPSQQCKTPSIDLTVYGRAKGSPSFMSPEQARGEWDRVGPASDIFSLGSTLFYVLTGKVPYEGRTSADVVAKVREGDVPSARRVNTDIPPALDAICRKAMAREPADRYASAKALADDVDRWLADEPVTAWREPLVDRVRRWGRRHRTLVTASAAALLVGFFVLAIYGYRLQKAHDREVTLRRRAETQEKIALEQKELADQRFQLALGSTASLVTDIQTKLIRSPGTKAIRESLLKDAIAKLTDLLQRADESRDVNRTLVWAHLRLGDLYRDVEQNPTRALAEYTRGLEFAKSLISQHAGHPLIAVDVIESLQRLGQAKLALGRLAEAATHYNEARTLIEGAGSLANEQRARNRSLRGELALERGDAPAATALFAEARTLWEKQASPTNDDASYNLAEVVLSQAQAAEGSGRYADAVAHGTAALNRWTELAERRPGDVTVQRKLALANHGLFRAHGLNGNHEPAARHLKEFFRIAESMASQDPENGEALLELAIAHQGIALDAIRRYDLKIVEEHAGKSHAMIQRLAKIDPDNLQSRRNYAIGLSKLGMLARARQQPTLAASRFSEAIQVCRRILTIAPDRAHSMADLAEWLRDVGMIYLRQLDMPKEGKEAFDESIQLWDKLVKLDSTNLQWQVRRLDAHAVLASWQKSRKLLDDADKTYRQALTAIEQLPENDREQRDVRRAAGVLRIDLTGLDYERTKRNDAIQSLEKEIAELDREARERPRSSHVWDLLDRHHTLLAELHTKNRQPAKAESHRRQAIEACRKGLELDPASSIFRRNLQLHLAHLAEQKRFIDPPAALKLLEESLAYSPHYPPDLAETSILRTSFAALEAKAGDCCEMLNRPKEGLAHYAKALEHHTKVAQIELNAPGIPGILAYDHRRMAELRLYDLDFEGAVGDYEKAKAILDQMRADKKRFGFEDLRTDSLVKAHLPFVKSLPKGIETIDAALDQPESIRLDALRIRIAWLIKAGKLDEAVATADRMAAEKIGMGDAIARAAEAFARLIIIDKPNAARHAARTIELLQSAKKAGYFKNETDIAWLDWETLFDPIRKDPEFQALVKAVRSQK